MGGCVVADASLALKWVVEEVYTVEAEAQLAEWTSQDIDVIAPGWFACEIANVLYQRVQRGRGTLADAQEGVRAILSIVTLRDIEPETAVRAIEIAHRFHQKASYDAQYLALAEHTDCELWTADEEFLRDVRGSFPRVRWIGQTI